MSEQPLTDPGSVPVGESRGRVLEALRAADGPLAARDVADRTGLHTNTARAHLDGLVAAGLAERRPEARVRPGRPRVVYRAAAVDGPVGQRSYRLLAGILAGLVTERLPDPERAAAGAGELWGRYLADRPAPWERIGAEEGVRRLTGVLADAGFAPEATGGPDRPLVIALRHCPFREVAEQHRGVVCSLHLGLMKGVLAELRTPVAAERLEPFVEPSLCLAHLAPAPPEQ
jgi:predicted ArsR family transcriptional regulator